MSETIMFSKVAFLLGDPARARMLAMLMSGQARTASELALDGGVVASTASRHLALMVEVGLIEVARQGRHRYFRLAGPQVASAIEAMMGVAPPPSRRVGPAAAELRRARVCYDHLAGELAVYWRQQMEVRGFLVCDNGMSLSEAGARWCLSKHIALEPPHASRRPLCRPCLDWSERRDHVAGILGAALLKRLFDSGLARRLPDSRAVEISARGERLLTRLE